MSITEAHARLTAPGQGFEMEEPVIQGVRQRTWKNAPPTLRDIFLNGRASGAREFLVYEDDCATDEAFFRAAIALARQLQADGVREGDRVAVIMRNLPERPVAFFAGVLAGAIVTPLNGGWTGPALQQGLADSGTRVAIVDDERLERIAPRPGELPELERIYVARLPENADPGPRTMRLETFIGPVNSWKDLPDSPLPDVAIDPDAAAAILYTSGTTGRPKDALCAHRNMTSNVMTSGIASARHFMRASQPLPESDPHKLPGRSLLLVASLFHATGLSATLGPTTNAGGKILKTELNSVFGGRE